MEEGRDFAVVELSNFEWSGLPCLPTPRFRLLVAADTASIGDEQLSEFARGALEAGMVYFCSWGHGCERLHDVVDRVLIDENVEERLLGRPAGNDVVMTTFHKGDTLENALEFLAWCATPTDGFAEGSSFRLVVCFGDSGWSERARTFLREATDFE